MNTKISEAQIIELLTNYTVFLESTLEEIGSSISENRIMEVTDNDFNVATDYMNRDIISGYRVGTVDVLDELFSESQPLVNIVYAQMPFKGYKQLIPKLALVPIKTDAIALFGTYGLKSDKKSNMESHKALRQFAELLEKNGFDYLDYIKETSNEYYELIISQKKKIKGI